MDQDLIFTGKCTTPSYKDSPTYFLFTKHKCKFTASSSVVLWEKSRNIIGKNSHQLPACRPGRHTPAWSPGPRWPRWCRPARCRDPRGGRRPSAGHSGTVSGPHLLLPPPGTGTERRPPARPGISAGSSLLINYDTFTIIGRALRRLWKLYKIMDNPRLDFNKMRKFSNKTREDKPLLTQILLLTKFPLLVFDYWEVWAGSVK